MTAPLLEHRGWCEQSECRVDHATASHYGRPWRYRTLCDDVVLSARPEVYGEVGEHTRWGVELTIDQLIYDDGAAFGFFTPAELRTVAAALIQQAERVEHFMKAETSG